MIPPGVFGPEETMDSPYAERRFAIGPESRPAFPRYARLHQDLARQRLVILAPERVYEVDAVGLAVLRLCNGERRVADIVSELAAIYSAPAEVIAKDVVKTLQGLADKRLLRDGPDRFASPALSQTASSYSPFAGGPAGLLAELTHRCPLQCPYCSNPLELERATAELSADEWGETFRQAAAAGVMQLHLSGGEPTARRDFDAILAHAVDAGLYTNLVTAGVLLTREHLERLAGIGLDHVQVSVQDVVPENADRISGYKGGVAKKRDLARWTRELGLGLTVNAPIHRENIDHLPEIIDFALEVDAQRIEIAHILRLGREKPRRADSHPREISRHRHACRRGEEAPGGRAEFRLCRPRPLLHAAEGLHGRLGPVDRGRHAFGARAAMPRRADAPRPRLR
jgi:pyrroloquinoline quinone biosynthesis protein E